MILLVLGAIPGRKSGPPLLLIAQKPKPPIAHRDHGRCALTLD